MTELRNKSCIYNYHNGVVDTLLYYISRGSPMAEALVLGTS